MQMQISRLLRRLEIQCAVIFLLFSAISIAIHYQGFHAPMILDSRLWINDNVQLFESGLFSAIKVFPSRAVFMASLYLDYLIGGMNPGTFRLSGALWLAATSTVLVLLSLLLFKIQTGCEETTWKVRVASLLVGLLFLVHPLQIFTVLYIWQRSGLMACFFCFSAMTVYLATRMGRFAWPVAGYSLVSAFFLLGMLTKENILSLPAVLLLAEITLFSGNLRGSLRRAFVIGLICIPPAIGYLLCAYGLKSDESVVPPVRFLVDNWSTNIPFPELLPTEARIIFFYLFMIVAPYLSGVHLLKAMEVSQSLWDPPVTVAACAGVLTLIGSGIALIRRAPVISFCILFTVVTVVPECLLIPRWPFFGYRPILASFGVFFTFASGVLFLLSRLEPLASSRALKAVAAAVLVAPVCALGAQTWTEAAKWNPMSLWRNAFLELPQEYSKVDRLSYSMIILHYSDELIKKGDYAAASDILRRAIKLTPSMSSLYTNLGVATTALGNPAEAVGFYQKALELEPLRAEHYLNLGAALLKMNDLQGAAENFKQAASLKPWYAKAHANLGITLLLLGQPKEAIEPLSMAVRNDPSLALAHSRLGTAYELSGDSEKAAVEYSSAFRLNPNLVEAHYGFARLMSREGNHDLAVRHYQISLKLAPGFSAAHNELGEILAGRLEFCEAAKSFRNALDTQPDFPEAKRNLEKASQKCSQGVKSVP